MTRNNSNVAFLFGDYGRGDDIATIRNFDVFIDVYGCQVWDVLRELKKYLFTDELRDEKPGFYVTYIVTWVESGALRELTDSPVLHLQIVSPSLCFHCLALKIMMLAIGMCIIMVYNEEINIPNKIDTRPLATSPSNLRTPVSTKQQIKLAIENPDAADDD